MADTINHGATEVANPRYSVNQRSMLLIGLFFLSISAFFFIYTPAKISENSSAYIRLTTIKPEFILQDTGFLLYYGGWLILATLLVMGLYSLFLAYKGERPRSFDKKITRAMGYSIVLGFILMISGKFVAQMYWSNTFEQAGYVECENSFGMTQSWSTKVWAFNAESCRTPFDQDAIRQKQAEIAVVPES
ncbi:hypothetical protein [Marinobacter sp. OP 3.4]|uniref:hypothetical protein n=1 Tax=Marinobacter sp. OP 3.4 TaxID=3076501 RepID=UPI002E1BBBD2